MSNIKEMLEKSLRLTGGVFYQGMFTEIAKKTGVSRERVRQVAKAMGLGSMRENLKKQNPKVCVNCGKPSGSHKLCSSDCRTEYTIKKYYNFTPCEICKKPIKYYKSREYLKPRFCSKVCQGINMGHYNRDRRHSRRSNILLTLTGSFVLLDIIDRFGVSRQTAWNYVSEQINLGNVKTMGRINRKIVYCLTNDN